MHAHGLPLKKDLVMNLNRIYNALSEVHAEDELKLKTKAAIADRLVKSGRRYRSAAVKLAAASVCVLLLAAGFGGYQMYSTPIYAISIDINPSIELGVNRLDRVVSAAAYNDSGNELLESLDIKNMRYTDAINALFSGSELQGYAEGGAEAVLVVSGGSERKNSEMLSAVKGCHYGSVQVYCYGSGSEIVQEAHENGLSAGKYKAYLELKQYDPSITVDEIRDMPMHEIRNMLSGYSGSGGSTEYRRHGSHGHSGGHGKGRRNAE